YGPDIDPAALDHAVTAFVTLEIRQAGGHDPVAERLGGLPAGLEGATIPRAGGMLCRGVARPQADVQRGGDAVAGRGAGGAGDAGVGVGGAARASAVPALAAQVPDRVLPLVRTVARSAPAHG